MSGFRCGGDKIVTIRVSQRNSRKAPDWKSPGLVFQSCVGPKALSREDGRECVRHQYAKVLASLLLLPRKRGFWAAFRSETGLRIALNGPISTSLAPAPQCPLKRPCNGQTKGSLHRRRIEQLPTKAKFTWCQARLLRHFGGKARVKHHKGGGE